MYWDPPVRPAKRKFALGKRHRQLLFIIAFLLLVLIFVYAVNLAASTNAWQNSTDWAKELRRQGEGQEEVFLLYGIDYWGANPYVEQLVVVHHDTGSGAVNLILVPGNTLVETGEQGEELLGQLYRREGNPAFIHRVQELTGLPVQHYLELNYQAIAVLADLLGGIEPRQLKYGGEGLLPAGSKPLGGFELYRYFTGSYGQTPEEQLQRRREVLLLLWERLSEKRFGRLARYMSKLRPYVETDLSWREMRELREQFKSYDFAEVAINHLPGEEKLINGGLCWVPDYGAIEDLLRQINNEGYSIPPEEIRVEVLNGTTIPGLAARLSAALEAEGFEVAGIGNADSADYEQTQVIALGTSVDKARTVALFVPEASMLHRPDPEATVDVRIIIGRNFEQNDD
ncbi:MAG TPA: LCP family protein [Bacillota bacterium]|nr:LCP family protein [Bacillota bacterium]HOB87271.1 LCP family protein [Bacillota bacterium]HOP69923.1 LCP family protein [Bacillota bacterium]HPT34090.1 LCP family protein [Bacillota bacterium]HPZ64753.1 LCP family protein [Bacillota bacterium]